MKSRKLEKLQKSHYIIDGKVLVSEINDLVSLKINDDDVDTIGGWILTENYEAKQGDTIHFDDYEFKVIRNGRPSY